MVKIKYEFKIDDPVADVIFRDYVGEQVMTMDDQEVKDLFKRIDSVTSLTVASIQWSGSSRRQRKATKEHCNEVLMPELMKYLSTYFADLVED